jgi:hypothetical protein
MTSAAGRCLCVRVVPGTIRRAAMTAMAGRVSSPPASSPRGVPVVADARREVELRRGGLPARSDVPQEPGARRREPDALEARSDAQRSPAAQRRASGALPARARGPSGSPPDARRVGRDARRRVSRPLEVQADRGAWWARPDGQRYPVAQRRALDGRASLVPGRLVSRSGERRACRDARRRRPLPGAAERWPSGRSRLGLSDERLGPVRLAGRARQAPVRYATGGPRLA